MRSPRVSDLLAPPFRDVWRAAHDPRFNEIWLAGGRGSCKSSCLSLLIVCGLLRDPEANAIVYRKVADTLRSSVYAQIEWAIDALGQSARWQRKLSPMEIIYRPTGQRILFSGADKPEKSKGIKLASGYFKYLWFEELTEFASIMDVQTITASVLRGSGKHMLTLYSYNPPMSARIWANEEAVKAVEGRYCQHSTYLDVPPEWLGDTFIAKAESMKRSNPTMYRHVYLGEVTGTGGEVFRNLVLRKLEPEEWQGLRLYSGLDFGFSIDPDCFVRCAYQRKTKTLYIVDEFAATGQLIEALAEAVKKRCGHDVVTCDNADPRSIAALRTKGLNVTASKKGPDSVNHGTKWLQTLTAIIIDPVKCPLASKEFSSYEYDRDKAGEPIPRYPDHDNHTIDAVRYAMESVSTQQAAIIPR